MNIGLVDVDSHNFPNLVLMKLSAYIMIYNKENAPRETRLLQRWVNNKYIFWACDRFEDFDSSIA